MRMKKEACFIIALNALIIFFLAKILFLKRIFFLGDTMYSFQPWWSFNAEGIRKGIIYLWNPYLCNGQAFIANIQTALFYPVTLLFYIFGFTLGYKFFVFSHLFLAGLFMYLLARKLKITKESSFVCAFIFSFGGYFLVQIEFFSAMGSCIWFPLIFLFFKESLENKKKIFFIIVAGITFSFQFFSGYTQILLYTVVALFLYVLLKSVKKTNAGKKYFLIFFIIGIISLTISLIHFLPVLEGVFYSSRAKVSFSDAVNWTLPPLFLIKFILPSLFGKTCAVFFSENPFGNVFWAIRQYWLTTFYIGILPLFFSLTALIFKHKNKLWPYLFLLLIVSLVFALGKNPFFYLFFFCNPLARIFTHYASFIYLSVFSLILLCGIGIDYFLDEKNRLFFLFIRICCVAVFCFVFAFIIFGMKEKFLLFTPFQQKWLFRNIFVFLLFLLGSLILFFLKGKISLPLLKVLVVTFIVVDLFMFGININPTIGDWFFKEKPANLKFIRERNGFSRIFFTPQAQTNRIMAGDVYQKAYKSLRDALQANIGLPYHIFYVYGYDFIPIAYYKSLLYKMREKSPIVADTKMMDVLGGRYIFSYQDLNSQKLKLISDGKVKIYENEDCLPRVFLVPEAKILHREEILDYLMSPEFKPHREVVLEKNAITQKGEIPDNKSERKYNPECLNRVDNVRITDYQSNKVKIQADLNRNSWLILTDTYYPGWQVYINGKRDEIYRANYALRAVYLNKGIHKINFIYKPATFKIGLYFTLFILFVLFGWGTKFCFKLY